MQCMIDAAEFVMGWPKNQGGRCTKMTMTIQQVCIALSAMSMAIQSVLNVISSTKTIQLLEHNSRLEERILTLKALQMIIPSLGKAQITIDDSFLGVDSVVGLLHLFVANGAFKSVECLLSSEHAQKVSISSDVVASASLRIPLSVHPRRFLPWLCDTVLPTLAIGHPLLGSIRQWTCKAADYYDEENVVGGIDSSIELLLVSDFKVGS